jgi:hypothetical protein
MFNTRISIKYRKEKEQASAHDNIGMPQDQHYRHKRKNSHRNSNIQQNLMEPAQNFSQVRRVYWIHFNFPDWQRSKQEYSDHCSGTSTTEKKSNFADVRNPKNIHHKSQHISAHFCRFGDSCPFQKGRGT